MINMNFGMIKWFGEMVFEQIMTENVSQSVKGILRFKQ